MCCNVKLVVVHDHGTATKITETGRVEASTHADAPIQIPYDLPDASPDVATNYLLSQVIVVHIRATNELTSMHYLHSYMTKRELPHYHALQFLPDGPLSSACTSSLVVPPRCSSCRNRCYPATPKLYGTTSPHSEKC